MSQDEAFRKSCDAFIARVNQWHKNGLIPPGTDSLTFEEELGGYCCRFTINFDVTVPIGDGKDDHGIMQQESNDKIARLNEAKSSCGNRSVICKVPGRNGEWAFISGGAYPWDVLKSFCTGYFSMKSSDTLIGTTILVKDEKACEEFDAIIHEQDRDADMTRFYFASRGGPRNIHPATLANDKITRLNEELTKKKPHWTPED